MNFVDCILCKYYFQIITASLKVSRNFPKWLHFTEKFPLLIGKLPWWRLPVKISGRSGIIARFFVPRWPRRLPSVLLASGVLSTNVQFTVLKSQRMWWPSEKWSRVIREGGFSVFSLSGKNVESSIILENKSCRICFHFMHRGHRRRVLIWLQIRCIKFLVGRQVEITRESHAHPLLFTF